MDEPLAQAAREYHRYPTPGKISVTPTKGMSNQRDLALAYSPGVAVPCLDIQKDPLKAYDYTAKGNLVAVISNGTAVLGLGNIGAMAGKPVMEGKGCLFKKFAGIDVFDIEIDETDPDKLVETIASLEPTFGGINLEDIKAPECFEIETRLRARMSSRLMPPKVGSRSLTVRMSSSGSSVAISRSKTSMSANFLNRQALPSITGLPASGPMLPSPSTAVPLVTTATRLPRAV